MKITQIRARQILDSRGNPTVEADVILENGMMGRAAVPSGASTGIHEAVELRDQDANIYQGKSVLQAVKNIHEHIAPAVTGLLAIDQEVIDKKMLELDGTENKSKLGANAILAVSLATARAAAMVKNQPLFQYLSKYRASNQDANKYVLPIPFMNVINGGKHAIGGVDFQEYMIVPHGFNTFAAALEAGTNVFHTLKKILHKEGYTTLVGDEGGFAPSFSANHQPLEYLMKAITEAKYEPGTQISIAMDPAVSELYDQQKNRYLLATEKTELTAGDMIDYWTNLVNKYPIISIEDPLDQDAWKDWQLMTTELGNKIQIVGDDFLVTNTARLNRAIESKSATAILIKVNQIGTLTEAIEAVNTALFQNWGAMISHRSGETEDTFISDLVVGLSAGQIKAGSLSRSDRIAKYNQLLRIEETLGDQAVYAGTMANTILHR